MQFNFLSSSHLFSRHFETDMETKAAKVYLTCKQHLWVALINSVDIFQAVVQFDNRLYSQTGLQTSD